VPREAVFSVDGIYKVFTLENGIAVEKSIGIGETTKDFAVIKSGLKENEEVIVLGRNLVEDGSRVSVQGGVKDTDPQQVPDSNSGVER